MTALIFTFQALLTDRFAKRYRWIPVAQIANKFPPVVGGEGTAQSLGRSSPSTAAIESSPHTSPLSEPPPLDRPDGGDRFATRDISEGDMSRSGIGPSPILRRDAGVTPGAAPDLPFGTCGGVE